MFKKAFSNTILTIVMVAVVVGIGGYIFSKKYISTNEPIYTPEPTPRSSETPTAFPTITSTTKDELLNWKTYKNWQTYTNTKLNFEFKYPSFLKRSDSDCIISDEHPNDIRWSCVSIFNIKDFEFDLYINPSTGRSGIPITNEVKSKISVGGIMTDYIIGDGLEFGTDKLDGNKLIIIKFLNAGDDYFLLFAFPNNSNVSVSEQLAKQIISTFKFIK